MMSIALCLAANEDWVCNRQHAAAQAGESLKIISRSREMTVIAQLPSRVAQRGFKTAHLVSNSQLPLLPRLLLRAAIEGTELLQAEVCKVSRA